MLSEWGNVWSEWGNAIFQHNQGSRHRKGRLHALCSCGESNPVLCDQWTLKPLSYPSPIQINLLYHRLVVISLSKLSCIQSREWTRSSCLHSFKVPWFNSICHPSALAYIYSWQHKENIHTSIDQCKVSPIVIFMLTMQMKINTPTEIGSVPSHTMLCKKEKIYADTRYITNGQPNQAYFVTNN